MNSKRKKILINPRKPLALAHPQWIIHSIIINGKQKTFYHIIDEDLKHIRKSRSKQLFAMWAYSSGSYKRWFHTKKKNVKTFSSFINISCDFFYFFFFIFRCIIAPFEWASFLWSDRWHFEKLASWIHSQICLEDLHKNKRTCNMRSEAPSVRRIQERLTEEERRKIMSE